MCVFVSVAARPHVLALILSDTVSFVYLVCLLCVCCEKLRLRTVVCRLFVCLVFWGDVVVFCCENLGKLSTARNHNLVC